MTRPSQDDSIPAGPVVLAVAGSDPSGGAGIQADLKTFAAIGVYGAAALTCLTVQNTRGVASFEPVSPALVRGQIRAVLADMPVSHVKTGMIGTAAVARAVKDALANFRGEIVCDPVIRASDGQALFRAADLAALRDNLLAGATVVTPNLPELQLLSGKKCAAKEEIAVAVHLLFADFPKLRAMVVTGGHGDEESDQVTDVLFRRGREPVQARHPRIRTQNTHGTGCTFASAFTAYHLLHGDDAEAFQGAAAFMDRLITRSAGICWGPGKGPLSHHLFREKGGIP